MQRRSSTRTSRRSYTVDAFATVPELQDVSGSPTATDDAGETGRDSDVAFESGADETDIEVSDAGDDDSGEDVDVADEDEADEQQGVAKALRTRPKTHTGHQRQSRRRRHRPTSSRLNQPSEDHTLHYRRLNEQLRFNSKEDKQQRLFGAPSSGHILSLDAVKQWRNLPVLPVDHQNGLCDISFADPQTLANLYQTEWLWYFEHHGRLAFEQRQTLTTIDHLEAQDYMPQTQPPRDFLVGRVDSPTLQTLSSRDSMSIAAAWSSNRATFRPTNEDIRRGFYINAGARIRQLEWMPHRDGVEQYLAVSVLPMRRSPHAQFDAPEAPAFSSSPPYKTALQIWRILTDSSDQHALKASLHTLLCTSWGDVKSFKFCPMRCKPQQRETPLLLAAIWSDGKLRILDISQAILSSANKAVRIERAAIELAPYDTVFTCLTWISPRLVAAACANGCVAIVDVHESLQDRQPNQRPSKYAALADTYIHNITSCWPSFPAHVFIVSMDGFFRLVDTRSESLSSPEASAQSTRSRAVLPGMIWSEHAQSAIIADDNFGIRAAPIRHMFSQFSVGRTKSTAIAIANSPCHPFLLLGTTAGDAVVFNPLARVFDHKRQLWTHTWFSHEWRRPTDQDQERLDDGGHRIKEHGLSRFVEGYKAENAQFKDGDGNNRNYVPQTVYEKETAVSAVAWNPNVHAGGWAAAGLADGLVRVEYIALSQ